MGITHQEGFNRRGTQRKSVAEAGGLGHRFGRRADTSLTGAYGAHGAPYLLDFLCYRVGCAVRTEIATKTLITEYSTTLTLITLATLLPLRQPHIPSQATN